MNSQKPKNGFVPHKRRGRVNHCSEFTFGALVNYETLNQYLRMKSDHNPENS